MAGEQFETSYGNIDYGFVAETDLRTKQFFFVELTGEDQVDVCDGATDNPIGILQNKPNLGERAIVRVFGVSKLRAGTAGLAVGANVGTDGDGRGIAKTTNKDIVTGKCLVAAGAQSPLVDGLIASVTVDCLKTSQLNV